jgi:hypothetical protein
MGNKCLCDNYSATSLFYIHSFLGNRPRDKSMRRTNTLSYTLRREVWRENIGARIGGMEMLEDHGESA